MLQQSHLQEPITLALHEDSTPSEDAAEGSFKTRNPENNKWQRQYVHIETKQSKFKKTVEMVLCVHGWENSSRSQAMSLLVFRLQFSCTDSSSRYKTASVSFDFGNYEDKASGQTDKATPNVVAYGPFNKTTRWNDVKADLKRNLNGGGEVGVDYMANAKMNAAVQWEISYQGKYFDEGSSYPIYDDKTAVTKGVEWHLKGKKLPDSASQAIEPDLLVAVLLKRDSMPNGEGIPFTGTFNMRLEAGLLHDLQQGRRRFFVPWKPEDEAMNFDPSCADHVRGDDGNNCMKKIDKENLGKLASGNVLTALCEIPGLGAM